MLSLCGCLVGPKYHPPTPPPAAPDYKDVPATYSEADVWKPANPNEAMLRGKWWEIFKDPELNALEDRLAIGNQNIKQAYENFMVARSLIRQARSQYFPVVNTAPAYTRTGSSSNLAGGAAANGGAVTASGFEIGLYNLPVDVSWAPDLFRRVRNTVRAAQYGAQLSAADLENTRLIEQATLAQIYFEIRGQDALIKVLDDTVAAFKKSLDLTVARYETGVDTMLSVTQARATLESAQAQAINARLARAQFEHAIATLIGTPAETFSIAVQPKIVTPPPIPTGVPSQLLERRPDIAAAERAMAQANAQIGIAYAAYYPALTLFANGGFQSANLSNLISWPSRFWAIGGSLPQTIFDAGLRRATVNQFIATYNAAVAGYRQTILTAFQQVEDNLAGVRILSEQSQKLIETVRSDQESLNFELARYESGVDPYLSVVIVQTSLLNHQVLLVNAQISEIVSAVQLIMALGGGWDRSQLPTPSQVTHKPSKADTKIVR